MQFALADARDMSQKLGVDVAQVVAAGGQGASAVADLSRKRKLLYPLSMHRQSARLTYTFFFCQRTMIGTASVMGSEHIPEAYERVSGACGTGSGGFLGMLRVALL